MSATPIGSHHARNVTLGSALLAALSASACCLGPLLLAALGFGGAGALAVLGSYRPHMLAATALLLAAGFYFTYRKRPAAAATDACGCDAPSPKAAKAGKIGLWLATGLVAVTAAAPHLVALVGKRDERRASTGTTSTPAIAHATIIVLGMDCEACATHLSAALAKLGGFHDLRLDLAAHNIDVAYEPAPGRLDAYVAAINELGYEAKLPATSEERR